MGGDDKGDCLGKCPSQYRANHRTRGRKAHENCSRPTVERRCETSSKKGFGELLVNVRYLQCIRNAVPAGMAKPGEDHEPLK